MEERVVLGLTEEVVFKGKNGEELKIIARIDSGATSSSLDEDLVDKLGLGPVIKQKLIKSASGQSMRDIIEVVVSVRGEGYTGEFSIADRDGMSYQVLIGQNILKQGKFLIDPLLETQKGK